MTYTKHVYIFSFERVPYVRKGNSKGSNVVQGPPNVHRTPNCGSSGGSAIPVVIEELLHDVGNSPSRRGRPLKSKSQPERQRGVFSSHLYIGVREDGKTRTSPGFENSPRCPRSSHDFGIERAAFPVWALPLIATSWNSSMAATGLRSAPARKNPVHVLLIRKETEGKKERRVCEHVRAPSSD